MLGTGRLYRSHYYISHPGALRPYPAAVSVTFSSQVFNLSAPILLFCNWSLMQSSVIDFLTAFCCPFLQLLQKTGCLLWAVGSFSSSCDLKAKSWLTQATLSSTPKTSNTSEANKWECVTNVMKVLSESVCSRKKRGFLGAWGKWLAGKDYLYWVQVQGYWCKKANLMYPNKENHLVCHKCAT